MLLNDLLEKLEAKRAEENEYIDKIEREEWSRHPLTSNLRTEISFKTLETLKAWSDGEFTRETSEGTAQLNAEALAIIKVLTGLSDYIDELIQGEQDGIDSGWS